MALSILDGNQSATTLSTILSSGQHITAHTVVSLGTQAITDITSAVSGTSVCVGAISISGTPSVTGSVSVLNFPASQSTTFGAVTGSVSVLNFPASQAVTFSAVSISNFPSTQPVSIASVTVGNTVTIAGTVTANPTGTQTIAGSVTLGAGTAQIGSVTASISNFPASTVVSAYGLGTDGIWRGLEMATGSNRLKVDAANLSGGSSFPISGSVTIGAGTAQIGSVTASISGTVPVSISSITIGSALPVGTNRIGVVTIGGGTITIGAGTEQIGSVTASVSNTNFSIKAVVALDGSSSAIVPTPQSSFRLYTPVGASKTLDNIFGANPAWIEPYTDLISFFSDSGVQNNYLHDGTQWIRDDYVTPAGTDALNGSFIIFNLSAESVINLSNGFTFVQLDNPLVSNSAMRVSLYNSSVTANTLAIQGTAVTTSNFTSTTASTLLATANNNRKVLTIFNEGAGNLHICAGATCTTIAYQRKLASNEFFQVPDQQTAITHSAVFATAGTARIVQIT